MADEYQRNDFGNGTGVHADDFKDDKNPGGGDSAGAGFFDTAFGLKKAVDEGDKLSIGMASVGMAIDILGMVLDPIGSLLTAGIGWLIEHLVIFRWPLDFLMGDPKGIDAAKEAINAEAAKVKQWSEDHAKATKDLMSSWTGPAADKFRADMEGVAAQIDALSDYVKFAGKQMSIAGALIGTVRGIVRDIIAMTLAAIVKAAIIAVALAPVTFGASIVAAIASTIAEVGVAIAKIGKKIADAAKTLAELLKLLAKTRGAADDVVKLSLGDLGKINLPGGGPKKPFTPKPPNGPPKAIEDVPTGGGTKPPENPLATPKPQKLGDIATWVVRDKLAKMPDATPELMKKFDYWCSMPMPELVKRFGKSAEYLEKAVKLMSDPTYGASGVAGKTIIDLMKNVPPAAEDQ
ncbi:WXG100 family type VII secretion target [Amycolatopsis benzoatilytica]|uniref:WXG100 family type VII secretion target n=1 Tax=Amycolatopsis benzoatilytica TaxID=346045 RepID=UPI0003A2B11A|nr:hypothetical protein [Amycolatopsis benzoatilytica]